MTPEQARAIFLPVHGAIGVLTLVGGFGALATQKGSPRHRWFGRAFVIGMAGAIMAATPVLVVTGNLFLTGMGGFAAYMTYTGWRLARAKGQAGGPGDQAVSVAMIVGGLAFAALGAKVLLRGNGLGIVALAMGLGSATFAGVHLRWFRADRATRTTWVSVHVGAIGGGLIAGLTAFGAAAGTNYVPAVPEPVWWLGPTVVLGPLLARMPRGRLPR